MNDFTKDELRMIAACVLPSPKEYFMWTDAQKSLHDKVMAMIDNYCEHETDGYTYYSSGERCTDFLTYACSDSPCFLKCKKCEELFR